MNKASTAVVAICLGFSLSTYTLPAHAADDSGPTVSPHQVAHCMLKRMKASQTESYRDAFKACRDQLNLSRADIATAMNAVLAPAVPKQ
jgi:hypothetical protein